MPLIFRDLRENRQLLGFLEAAEADRAGAGFRGDDNHRGVRPVGGRSRGDEIGDARTVLRDADAVAAGDAAIAVGHMTRTLLVHGRDETNSGGWKQVEGVHERRADDAEDVCDAIGNEGFDEGLARGHSGHGWAPSRQQCCSRSSQKTRQHVSSSGMRQPAKSIIS